MSDGHASAVSPGVKARLGGWLQLARISNAPTVATNVFVGAALAGLNISSPDVLLTVGWVCLLYFAGMILNDLCDLKIDRKERSERPLVQGTVSPIAAAIAVLVLVLVACEGLRRVSYGDALIPALVLVGLIILYDVWHKGNPFSSIVMGACRAMVYVVAFSVFETLNVSRLLLPCILIIVYIAAITLLARNESSNKPILWPVVLLFAPALYPVLSAWGPGGLGTGIADWRLSTPAILLFVFWTVVALRPIMGAGDTHVGCAVARLLAGITLVDALFVSTLCEWTFASGDDGVSISMGVIALSPLIACGLMFGLTLVLQRRVQAS